MIPSSAVFFSTHSVGQEIQGEDRRAGEETKKNWQQLLKLVACCRRQHQSQRSSLLPQHTWTSRLFRWSDGSPEGWRKKRQGGVVGKTTPPLTLIPPPFGRPRAETASPFVQGCYRAPTAQATSVSSHKGRNTNLLAAGGTYLFSACGVVESGPESDARDTRSNCFTPTRVGRPSAGHGGTPTRGGGGAAECRKGTLGELQGASHL